MMPPDAESAPPLTATGERLMTDNRTHTMAEHLHRYAIAGRFVAGKTVLDVASGEGYGSHLLATQAAFVYGVDVAADAVAHASRKYPRDNLRFLRGSATAIPLADAAVDVVVSFETLEHLREHDQMMTEIRRVLRPGGMLVISSPDKRYYSDLPGYQNPFHLRELYREEFHALVRRFFRHARFFVQRMSYGSLVVPEDPAGGFVEYRGDFAAVDAHDGLEAADYNLAIASDEPVAEIPGSLWNARGIIEPPAEEGRPPEQAMPAEQARPPEQAKPRRSVAERIGREIGRIWKQLGGIGRLEQAGKPRHSRGE